MAYALVFSPFNTIGARLGSWERSSDVSSMHGYVRELFYSNNTSVYYAGSFRCIQTSKWFPEGINLPSDIVSRFSISSVLVTQCFILFQVSGGSH